MKYILLFIWMGVIFYFSQQTGSESSETSKLIMNIIKFFGIDLDSMLGDLAQYLIRKCAHMFEYFILCLLIYNVVRDKVEHKYLWSVFLSFIYALSDEFHQMFVDNRNGSFIDVLFDTAGAGIAIFLIYFITKNKLKVSE